MTQYSEEVDQIIYAHRPHLDSFKPKDWFMLAIAALDQGLAEYRQLHGKRLDKQNVLLLSLRQLYRMTTRPHDFN